MGGRRLTAILAADIAGYSALMGSNDVDTVADLKGHQSVILPMIAGYDGRVIDTAGDGILAEFPSVFNAVKCAIAIQEVMWERNASVAPERRMQYRIGINQGDVLFDDERIYGDGINIAARLEGLCEPGGICISGKVYEEIKGRLEIHYEDIGEQVLKNISAPVRTYKINLLGPKKDGSSLSGGSREALPVSKILRPRVLGLVVAAGFIALLLVVGLRLVMQTSPAPTAKLYDGFWRVTLTGGTHCGLKSHVWRVAIENGAITPSREPGRVEANGHFLFSSFSQVDPSITIRYRGQLTDETGRGEYRSGVCEGIIELKRLARP